jgi:hypothetical protein
MPAPPENLHIRILQPVGLHPSQWAHARSETWLQRLCLAVLEDALNCLRPETRHWERREAEAWFASRATGAFSFIFVCEVLDIDVDYFRRKRRGSS